jgi:hypothetical protein
MMRHAMSVVHVGLVGKCLVATESKPVSAQIACSASGYDTAMAGAVDLDLRDWVAPGVAPAPRLGARYG